MQQGAAFEVVAREHSDAPSAVRGGDLGWVQRGQISEEFDAVAFSQPIDAFSPVLKTPKGYHIIQVLAREAGGPASKDEVVRLLKSRTRQQVFKGYVDRLLLTCEAYHIKPVILFNKIDLLSAEGLQRLDDYQQLYNAAGYEIHAISAKDKGYADEIREILQGKVSFLVGRSGAGKSATVNLVAPELKLKIGDVSDFSGRGKHTTTFAEMFELPFGARYTILLGASLILVICLTLVAFGWSARTARVGATWSFSLFLGIYAIASAWGTSGMRMQNGVELWSPDQPPIQH